MDDIIWKRVKPLNQTNILNKFEQDYGIVLPYILRKLIIDNNGGRPSLDIINTAEGKELEVKSLLSFNKEDTDNIYNVIEYFKNQFDGKILPIATEPSGDYFCMDLTNNSIVYWAHETNELTFIAKDFIEFFDRLYKL